MSGLLDRLMAELAFDGGWHLVSDNPETGVRKYVSVQMAGDQFQVVIKTENYAIGALFDQNAEFRSETDGKRIGDWQRLVSVPTDIWNRELAEAFDQDDDKYLDRWMNDVDHEKFRTSGGTV